MAKWPSYTLALNTSLDVNGTHKGATAFLPSGPVPSRRKLKGRVRPATSFYTVGVVFDVSYKCCAPEVSGKKISLEINLSPYGYRHYL